MSQLIINPMGGLANRMRSMASGIALAGALGIDYRIIWAVNDELKARFDQLFASTEDIKGKILYPGAAEYALAYSIPRKKNLYLSKIALRNYSLYLSDSLEPMRSLMAQDRSAEAIEQLCAQTIARQPQGNLYIQSGQEYYHFSPAFYRSIFHVADHIREKADKVIAQLGPKPIGVHIRRTDNMESRRHSPDSLFVNAIANYLEHNPQGKAYVASDCEQTKQMLGQRFPGAIVTSASQACRTTLAGMQEALTEMYILSQCSKIFGSYYSSYSEAASLLGQTELEQLTGS